MIDSFESSPDRKIDARAALAQRLSRAGIDTSRWGQGNTKTLDHLLDEIDKGESVLTETSDGKITRKLSALRLAITYTTLDGKRLRLIERKQVFSDGRVRERGFDVSVAEKLAVGEDPVAAIPRALKEELGVEGEVIKVRNQGRMTDTHDSLSYPGLMTEHLYYQFDIELSDAQFKPEGYMEVQSDKTTYFEWEEVR